MSWLFSRALVEEYSAASCLDGAPSAQLNVMPTPHKFWRNDKTMEPLNLSQFGLTCVLLTDGHGRELLTSYLAAFPAKTLAPQELGRASLEPAPGFGERWPASLARYDPATSLWKTAQCSLLGDSESFSETWPRWGSMLNGALYLRPRPVLRTSGSEFGLWQTPIADDAVERKAGKWNSRGEPKLSAQVKMLPTPLAHPGSNRRTKPTPAQAAGKAGMQLAGLVGGSLNPVWVEWLMGWPLGWTDSRPLETDKFPGWFSSHGACCPNEQHSFHTTIRG
jgi:hypothetical protein